MKPDSRYHNMAAIGYCMPEEVEFKKWKKRYGVSKAVSRNENLMLSRNKLLSLGKVKSYGSVTTVVCSSG
jgi:hypothetical protein